jgi:hypothetical protein
LSPAPQSIEPNDNAEPSVVGETGDVALATTAAIAANPPQQFTVRCCIICIWSHNLTMFSSRFLPDISNPVSTTTFIIISDNLHDVLVSLTLKITQRHRRPSHSCSCWISRIRCQWWWWSSCSFIRAPRPADARSYPLRSIKPLWATTTDVQCIAFSACGHPCTQPTTTDPKLWPCSQEIERRPQTCQFRFIWCSYTMVSI